MPLFLIGLAPPLPERLAETNAAHLRLLGRKIGDSLVLGLKLGHLGVEVIDSTVYVVLSRQVCDLHSDAPQGLGMVVGCQNSFRGKFAVARRVKQRICDYRVKYLPANGSGRLTYRAVVVMVMPLPVRPAR